MTKQYLVLSIVWIILLSLTSIRAPLAQKYKDQAAADQDNNMQPREETVIARTSVMILHHIAEARAKIRDNAPDSDGHGLNHGGETAHH